MFECLECLEVRLPWFVGPQVGSFASVDSLMDLQSLGELFRKLHEEAEVEEVGRKVGEKGLRKVEN